MKRLVGILTLCLLWSVPASADVFATRPTGTSATAFAPTSLIRMMDDGSSPTTVAPVRIAGTDIGVSALAMDSSGNLWGFRHLTGPDRSVLIRINRSTGAATVVGAGTPIAGRIMGAAFDLSDRLYVYQATADFIQQLNTSTLAYTGPRVALGFDAYEGDLAFQADGRLYFAALIAAPVTTVVDLFRVNLGAGTFDGSVGPITMDTIPAAADRHDNGNLAITGLAPLPPEISPRYPARFALAEMNRDNEFVEFYIGGASKPSSNIGTGGSAEFGTDLANWVGPTDSDNDGLFDINEDYNGDGDPQNDDTDGDGLADYLDPDDDDDGLLTSTENADPNGDNDPADALDGDGDSTPDYLDSKDLVVSQVDATAVTTDPQDLDASGNVTVTVENQGTETATGPIGIRVFRDVDGDGMFGPGDVTLGSASVGTMAPGANLSAVVPIAATLDFLGEPIYALVDSAGAVSEGAETNNVGNSGEDCGELAPRGVFTPPSELWHWDGDPLVDPTFFQVMATPIIAQLDDDNADGVVDGDDTPEVIFPTFQLTRWQQTGVLRAVRGSDGTRVWPTVASTYRVSSRYAVAVAELDAGSPGPEIVACGVNSLATTPSRFNVLIIAADGSLIREITSGPSCASSPTIADVDGDGVPEIFNVNRAIHADGTVVQTGLANLSHMLDVDGDGDLEYASVSGFVQGDGTAIWSGGAGRAGYADFDADGLADVFSIDSANVRLRSGIDGSEIYRVPNTFGRQPSPPSFTIADFNGDGTPDAAALVAQYFMTAWDGSDGSVMWSLPVYDQSNGTQISSADFNGDGRYEVVYRSQHRFYIHDGLTGAPLYDTCLMNGTLIERPTIADANGDGVIDIAVSVNDYFNRARCGVRSGGRHGVILMSSSDWVGGPKIWNQEDYSITHINPDMTVPRVPVQNAIIHNTQNAQASATGAKEPNVTASFLRADVSVVGQVTFTARVGNGGATIVPPGVEVKFYDGDPAVAGTMLIGTTTTSIALQPGEFEDVTFLWMSPPRILPNDHTVWVVTDSASTLVECVETDNAHSIVYPDVDCLDDRTGTGVDAGCSAPTGFCDASGASPVCVECIVGSHCSDGNDCTSDVCSAGGTCSNPPLVAGTSCAAGVCDGASSCTPCLNDASAGSVDSGCSAAAPACLDSAAPPMCVECIADADCASGVCGPGNSCVPCLDTMAGVGIDNGCSPTAPLCTGSGTASAMCVPCIDDTAGALDTGCPAVSPVCDPTGPVCQTCEDNNSGTTVDNGCAASVPLCDTSGAAPVCVECIANSDCAAGTICGPANTCVPGCDDMADCAATPGTPICDTAAMVCVECLTTMDCPGITTCGSSSTCEFPDSDMDGTPDDEDLDDDNDGILDEDELGGTDLSADSDGDGIPDYADPSVTTDCADTTADGVCDTFPISVDQDGDGIPNHLDLDSDNDGIVDLIEGGGDDTDEDGLIDDFMDGDGDGVDDGVEAAPLPVPDTDEDDLPDFLDLDSDDDGLTDANEGGGTDADGDGIVDGFDDGNGDGVDDGVESAPLPVPDSDGDGVPDYQDVDADGDEIPDAIEGHDDDSDGAPDATPSGTDSDGDGLDDAFDPDCATAADCGGTLGSAAPEPDEDGDTIPDWLDIDSDGDGIPDGVECSADPCEDTDMDGNPDYLDTDADGDSVPDATEGHDDDADGAPDATPSGTDTDGDGLDDAFDPDCATAADCGGTIGAAAPVPDRDEDGAPDFQDADDDDDGIDTATEEMDEDTYGDPDMDGIPPYLDDDSDDDGVPDVTEAGLDLDEDGIPDYLDPDSSPTDSDMDGIPDVLECPDGDITDPTTCRDTDGDGMPDMNDPDDDGDGVPTSDEIPIDDTDGDGQPDHLDIDDDNDGVPTAVECTGDPCEDTDEDGVPDYLDDDSDGDGIPDATEGHDADMDGVPDATPSGSDADEDGLDDAYDPDAGGTAAPTQDTDGDGVPDYQDVDSDGDGASDAMECMDPAACPDTDGDGTPDYLDADDAPVDTDMDGLIDVLECPPPATPGDDACPDTDGDGSPDWNDPDDDGDGVPTADELGDPMAPNDTDGDGAPDYLDTDDDGDGVPTETELPNGDTDSDGTPDYLDTDDDNDGILTITENTAPQGADFDEDGTPNYLDLDSDGDGASDEDEGEGDSDGDGAPNYLDVEAGAGGLSGGALCATSPAGQPSACWLLVAALFAWRRRR